MSEEAIPAFLAGPSTMARLMRERDWSGSPLGAPQSWPQSLRSTVNLMLGSAFPMFVAWGPSLTTLYNDAYAEIVGIKHPSAAGQNFLEVWSEIRGTLEPLVARALSGESFFMENLPLRIRRRGVDEDTWFTFSYSPVLDDAGRIAGLYCACTETTALVQAERQQRAGHDWLQQLFSQSPGFMAVMRGPTHVIELANQAYFQLTGFREVIGKTLADALPEVVEQGFVRLLDEVFESGQPYVGRSVRVFLNRVAGGPLDEAYVDYVFQPITDASGRVESILVQGQEVTDQHRAQQALRTFSDSIPAMAWEAVPDGAVKHFNSQWYSYTGQQEGDAIRYGWQAAVHPEDLPTFAAAWREARLQTLPWQVEHRLRRYDGAWRWFLSRGVPHLDANGQAIGWIGTSTDIEEAMRNAQALRDADRQKDEFLATLAHELRNPLAPIRTAVHLLALPGASETTRQRAAEVIGRQVSHMSRLLDDLIDIARITQRRLVLKKEHVVVDSVVEAALETARPLADAKQHRLTATVAQPGLKVDADPVRLAQMLSNLLNNASKYTDAGGDIALDVRAEGEQLCFSVTDSGIGMTPETLHTVFTMFAQEQSALDRSEGGLGVGLALVKGLAELHAGTVTAHSEGPGRGSRFDVRLPWQPAIAPIVTTQAAAVADVAPSRSVLLADDNRDAVDILAELLRMDGHQVHTAHDGLEAVELASQLQPDVLVLDIGMPGLNGYEVACKVRAQPWGAKPLLIAATGWGQEDDRQRAMAAGFNVHLTKPFDPAALMALIDRRP